MNVTFRTAGPADREAVVALVREFTAHEGCARTEEHIAAGLDPLLSSSRWGWVAVAETVPEDGGVPEVVGYAVLTWGWGLESGGKEALLDEFYVRRRGQGIGTGLFRYCLGLARDAGARTFFLETEADHERVRAFYGREGLTVEDSVWMRADLTAD